MEKNIHAKQNESDEKLHLTPQLKRREMVANTYCAENLTKEQMADLIEELIVVDTEEGFVTMSNTDKKVITFSTKFKDKYKVRVIKL